MAPEQTPNPENEPLSLHDVIDSILADENFAAGLENADEQERAQQVAMLDAAVAVQDLEEQENDLKARMRAGEKIDPEHRAHIQQLLLAARAKFIELHGPPNP